MTVTIIAAVVGAVVGAVGTALVAWLASGHRLEQQQLAERRAHEALPAYERVARAYEQAAGRGGIIYASPEKSEEYYRQAARIRREAEEDMLAGRTPLTRPRDEKDEGQGGGRAAMNAVADYVRSRVARDHDPDPQPDPPVRLPKRRAGGVPTVDAEVEYLRQLEVIRRMRWH